MSPQQESNGKDADGHNGAARRQAGPSGMTATIEDQRAKANFVYSEELAPGLKLELDLKRILCSTQSPYQKIDVIETTYGKVRSCTY